MNVANDKIGSTIVRWGKFNLVGAVGMAVQLGALALINHLAPGRYMLATAAAIEIALLHNFAAHLHYTWRDRFPTLNTKRVFRMGRPDDRGALAGHLIRFHLSNGLVSLVGNLALMHLLLDSARIPVVAANAIAILCCSIVNFFLGDQWAFAQPLNASASAPQHESPRRMPALAGHCDRTAADSWCGPAPASCSARNPRR